MGTGKAILIWGLLGLGLLFLLTRKSSGYAREYDDGVETIPFHPLPSAGAHQYKNKEVWSILWNEDGLPSQVTIERNALST